MNVKILNPTNVTRTPCVPTLKGSTSVAVWEVTKVMADIAQVKVSELLHFAFVTVSKLVRRYT